MRLRVASDERLVACIRSGDATAFATAYERHSPALLGFCRYMLGSRQDAEDVVQSTFAAAYRGLRADRRPVTLRPWLFAIARNESLDVLRKRRATVELNGEPALTGDPARHAELREEIRQIASDVRALPEQQRAALMLAELDGLSQVEIGTVLGVRADQVKAYIYQARSNLLSEREAREADCGAIREELATARGPALRRGHLRRHVRACSGCSEYASAVARQQRQLRALIPITPMLALKYRVLEQALGIGAAEPTSYAGGAAAGSAFVAELASGGIKALAIKIAAGMAALGASAGVGVSVLETHPGVPAAHAAAAAQAPRTLIASAGPVASTRGRTAAGASSWARNEGASTLAPSAQALAQPGAGARDGAGSSPSSDPSVGTVAPPQGDGGSPPDEAKKRTSSTPTGRHQATGAAVPNASQEERQRERSASQAKHEQRVLQREERAHERGERRLSHEERRQGKHATPEEEAASGESPEPVGLGGPPKRTKEEREERRREREERRRKAEEGETPLG